MPKPFYIELKMLTLLGKPEISPFDLKPYIKNLSMKEITEEIITHEFGRLKTIPTRPIGEGTQKKAR
jgi:hypothetical protein